MDGEASGESGYEGKLGWKKGGGGGVGEAWPRLSVPRTC